MVSASHLLRQLAGIILFFLSAAWAFFQWRAAHEQLAWREFARTAPIATVTERSDFPDLPAANARLARFFADEVFPPDHERALQFLIRTVRADPQSSTVWFSIAREQLLLGRRVEARAALMRSDALDPHYPKHRFGAIQLWSLLGERDRAISLAQRFNELGGRFSIESGRQLKRIGMSPAEIFDALEFERETADRQVALLKEIQTGDREQMSASLEKIDVKTIGDTATRSAMARLASWPVAYEKALEVWRAESPELLLVGGKLPADNLTLRQPPFAKDFYFGWQLPMIGDKGKKKGEIELPAEGDPEFHSELQTESVEANVDAASDPSSTPKPGGRFGVNVQWLAPPANSMVLPGQIKATLPELETEWKYEWEFYRFPAPENVGFEIQISCRNSLRANAVLKFQCFADGAAIQSAAADPLNDGWQVVQFKIPAAKTARLIGIRMICPIKPSLEASMRGPFEVGVNGLDFQVETETP